MKRVTGKRTFNGYTFRGVDDWHCFVTDQRGQWFIFTTEVSRHWLSLPDGMGENDEGVLAVGLLMAIAGETPTPLNPEFIDDTEAHFGEPVDLPDGIIQDGADFWRGDDLLKQYTGMVRHDFDVAGAMRARKRFLAEYKTANSYRRMMVLAEGEARS